MDDHSGEAINLPTSKAWPKQIHGILRRYDVRQVTYVPDGGHAELIAHAEADHGMRAIPLTTEEEGVALIAGAALGGQRAVLLMQSSGVGNCLNMLSLIRICRFPFLALVTMRGEWGEANPWQVPMGAAVAQTFALMEVSVLRAETTEDVSSAVQAGARMVFEGGTPTAVLLSQRLIGAKVFAK